MSSEESENVKRFRFVVEVDADVSEDGLWKRKGDITLACDQVLADEIASNLESLRGIKRVVIAPAKEI